MTHKGLDGCGREEMQITGLEPGTF